MSLTKDDLQAIKTIVQDTVQPMIDESDIQTANAFAEVHERIELVDAKIDGVEERLDAKIDGVELRLGRRIDDVKDQLEVKDLKLENTVQRVDSIELEVKKFKPA